MNNDQRRNSIGLVPLMLLTAAILLSACGQSQKKSTSAARPAGSSAVVGMSTCATCHTVVTADWLASPHANLDPANPTDLSFTGNPATGAIGACAKNCHDLSGDSGFLTSGVTGNIARPVTGCEDCHGPGSEHHGSGPIGPSRLAAGTFGTTSVSGWFNTCNDCHELLDSSGTTTNPSPAHLTTAPTGTQYTITDTHFATGGDFTATGPNSANKKNITGYAMDYASERACLDCHNPHKPIDILREWKKSAHADTYANYAPDTTTVDPLGFFSGAWAHYNWSCNTANCGSSGNRAPCQRCHTTTGYAAFANALETSNMALAEAIRMGASPQVTYSATFKPEMLKCNGCHKDNKGSLRNPGPITANYDYASGSTTYSVASHTYPDVSYSNLCMACHTGRESGETIRNLNAPGMPATNLNNFSFINSHYLTAGGTVFTATGYEFGGRSYENPSSYRHYRIGSSLEPNTGTRGPCIGCHMSRPGGAGDHLFLPVGRDASGITGIASEVCFVCHVIPNNMLTDSTNERREEFHAALEALKRELDKQSFYFAPAYPYFYNPRTTAGTVTLTNGSPTVTGTGTAWSTAGIEVGATTGDMFRAYDGTYYRILTVNSDTQLTLASNYTGPTIATPYPYAVVRLNSSTYTTGTVAVANGSATMTGTGTTWTAAGIVAGPAGTPFRDSNGVYYTIASVDSDTQLTLAANYAGTTATGRTYTIVKNSGYTTGTGTLTNGSAIVTGVGTNWTTAGIVPGTSGDPFRDSNGVYYTIQSVDSDTQLTLSTTYAGATAAGQSYSVVRYGPANGIKDWDPTNAGGTNGGTLAEHNMGAAFNFNILEHDPGAYVHNSYYVRRLIYDAIDWVDDENMNYSVGTTLNNLTNETYKTNAMKYLLPGGVSSTSGERP